VSQRKSEKTQHLDSSEATLRNSAWKAFFRYSVAQTVRVANGGI